MLKIEHRYVCYEEQKIAERNIFVNIQVNP
jgi:hypothetical protein